MARIKTHYVDVGDKIVELNDVWRLHAVDFMTYGEIAAELEVPVTSLKTAMRKAGYHMTRRQKARFEKARDRIRRESENAVQS